MDDNIFSQEKIAQNYLTFLQSPDGQFQQQILYQGLLPRLPQRGAKLLDAACGSGWLTKLLVDDGYTMNGCDGSKILLHEAQQQYPGLSFNSADITTLLPYPEQEFDCAVLNMAAQDIASIPSMYNNLYKILKPDGKLLITIPNPAYAYPVGVWKRGFWRALLGKKPRLLLNHGVEKPDPAKPVSTYPRPLSTYINEAVKQHFQLTYMEELRSKTDNTSFGLQYQMYRYPLIVLLDFIRL